MSENICLIGNPNCGKTSLFNALTGAREKTGNWSGVTVEGKVGKYKGDKEIKITDLPGVYSLIPLSKDEKEVADLLKETKPTKIINVVDGTNLERGLFLTAELLALDIPMIVAINFCDQIKGKKEKLILSKLEKFFGVEFLYISAKKDINVDLLMDKVKVVNKPNEIIAKSLMDKSELANKIKVELKDILADKKGKGELITNKIDKVLLHKIFGIPILFCVIFTVYFLSFKIGGLLSNELSYFFESFGNTTRIAMSNAGLPEWFISLFTSVIFTGVGSILAFTPQLLLLYLFMTIIEESGYAMRITFLLDRVFTSFGLGGKSCIPIMLSCGCSATGIMATRTLENESERKSTIFISPFMPCGAKMAVFGWLSYVFFSGNALIATSMYFIGFLSIIVFGKLLKKINLFDNDKGKFIIEMPIYRFPSAREIFRVLWEKTKDFVYKSGTVIAAVSTVVWVMSHFGFNGYTLKIEESFIYTIGNSIKFIFKPLGFGNWQASVSLITGIFAKEAVIETFEMLNIDLSLLFANKFSVYAFMCFLLLSPPCIASLFSAKKELKNKKQFVIMLIFQFLAGYILALSVVIVGKLIYLPLRLLFCIIIAIMFVIISIAVIRKRITCHNCYNCAGGKCQKK